MIFKIPFLRYQIIFHPVSGTSVAAFPLIQELNKIEVTVPGSIITDFKEHQFDYITSCGLTLPGGYLSMGLPRPFLNPIKNFSPTCQTVLTLTGMYLSGVNKAYIDGNYGEHWAFPTQVINDEMVLVTINPSFKHGMFYLGLPSNNPLQMSEKYFISYNTPNIDYYTGSYINASVITLIGNSLQSSQFVAFPTNSTPTQGLMQVINENNLLVTVPSGVIFGNITVTSFCNDQAMITIDNKPLVINLSPIRGKCGDIVTIQGRNFATAINIKLKSTGMIQSGSEWYPPFQIINNEHIVFTVTSALLGVYNNVQVVNDYGTSSYNEEIRFLKEVPASVVITNFHPLVFQAGKQITISGTNLDKIDQVIFSSFNTTEDYYAEFTPINASYGIATIPSTLPGLPTYYYITLKTPCNEYSFNWRYYIQSFSPRIGNDDLQEYPLSIYPNPASSFIRLNTSYPKAIIHISNIFDSKVKMLLYKNGDEVDITGLPQGAYLLKVETEKEVTIHKLIITR